MALFSFYGKDIKDTRLITVGYYLYEGIGMRQLMDYYFTLLNLGESNYALVKKEIKELGLQKILSAVMYVEYEVCERSIRT